MANKIQFKRGLKASLPRLTLAEPAFCSDTEELFIGSNSGNVGIVGTNKIINNLISGGSDKVLSAEQGKILKSIIDNKPIVVQVLTENPTAPVNGELWFLKTNTTNQTAIVFDAYKNNTTNLGSISNVSNRKAGIYFVPSRDFILDKIEIKLTSRYSAIHQYAEPITVNLTTVVNNEPTTLILDSSIVSGIKTPDTYFTISPSFTNNIKLKANTTYCFVLQGFSTNAYYYSVVGIVANNYSNLGSLSFVEGDGWLRDDSQEPDIKIYERIV